MPILKPLTSIALFTLIAAQQSAPAQAKDKSPAGKEEAAIMAVIDGQIAARWANDLDKWSTYWVHAPYVRRLGASPISGVTYVEGWDAIANKMKQDMAAGTKMPPVTRDNYNIRVYKDSAFATFDQRGEWKGAKFISRETRILEKHEGQWKLVYLGHVAGPDGPVAATPTPALVPAAAQSAPAKAR